MNIHRRNKLGRHLQASPEAIEERGWQDLAAPVNEERLADFEQQSVWDINSFTTPDGTVKVFTAKMVVGDALAEHIEELQEHFSAINGGEPPFIWEDPIDSLKTRVSFFLDGPVIGYDLRVLESAEEQLQTHEPLSWQHPTFWARQQPDLSDHASNQ